MKTILTALAIFLFFATTTATAQSLITYPAPANIKASRMYQVTVTQNGVSKNSFVYTNNAGNVASAYLNSQLGKTFNFSIFSFSGPVNIKVAKLGSGADFATVRPARAGIGKLRCQAGAGNAVVSFNVDKPCKLSIEFSDDDANNNPLMIFADSVEDKNMVPDKQSNTVFLADDSLSLQNIPADKTVVYFAPGVHNIGRFKIPSRISQVYISGGSFIRGYLYADRKNGKPLTINGRGILSQNSFPFHYPDANPANSNSSAWYKAIELTGGSGHLIEGITLIDGTAFYIYLGANNSTISNININGFKFNNDALTLIGNYINVKNCFFRDNDDAIVLYTSNLKVDNCIFWQLNNSIIQLGWRPHSMANNVVSNCDVIHAEWTSGLQENSGFITAMNALKGQEQQGAVIQNFTISNIYFDTPVTKFLDIRGDRKWGRQDKNSYTPTDKPWIYKNFNFKNIYFHSNSNNDSNLIQIAGFNQDNPITNFNFSNIFVDGKKMSGDDSFKNMTNGKKNVLNLKLLTN
jgi:hypothetical protein